MVSTLSEAKVVGIAEIAISDSPADIIVTYSLGSCLGVTIYDPIAGIGGLAHFVLPISKDHDDKATERPGMFVDTGFVHLIRTFEEKGGDRNRAIIKLAGAANPIAATARFAIGKRNHAVFCRLLMKNGLEAQGEDVGGTVPRTLLLHMADGKTVMKTHEAEVEL